MLVGVVAELDAGIIEIGRHPDIPGRGGAAFLDRLAQVAIDSAGPGTLARKEAGKDRETRIGWRRV